MEGFEEAKEMEPELVISRPPLLRQPPYTWLGISDGEENERQTFYNITENRCYVRCIPELKNKYVSWCQKGWLVVMDKCTQDCSLLNILTVEKLQLPPLHIPHHQQHNCVLSMSPNREIDASCRIIFLEGTNQKFRSCHFGDTEFVEQRHIIDGGSDGIFQAVNFEGKLFAFTGLKFHLYRYDFSDPQLGSYVCVIDGGSIYDTMRSTGNKRRYHIGESCGDLLLVCIRSLDYEVSDVLVFRANFSTKEWEELKNIGDRAIFIEPYNTFSTPASEFGLKGNAIYWVNKRGKNFYVYDLEENTVSTCVPCPGAGLNSYLFWVSL